MEQERLFYSDSDYAVQRGFTQSTLQNADAGLGRQLEAIAYEENNNTEIMCMAITFGSSNVANSTIAYLLIQGYIE